MGGAPWVDAREGHRLREDRPRRQIDMECRCTRGAVEWTWGAVAFKWEAPLFRQ